MKNFYFYILAMFAFLLFGNSYVYAQCTAVNTDVPTTNGRTYSTLPACNGLFTNMEAPPTGYLVMSGLETNGVYTIERTGGNGSNYLTARSTPTAGTVFGHGTGPLTFQVTTGTVANIVVTGANTPSCITGTAWNGTSTVLQYRRVQPNVPTTPAITFNCGTNTTILTSGGGVVGSITPAYQWQGSDDNTNWTNITGATATTYNISAATTPQYLFYRMRAGYGSCFRFSASITTPPRGNYTGNVTIASNVTLGGVYNITGNFVINTGVTVTAAQGCVLTINATNITVNGTINANGAGNIGGTGGARGAERDDGSCAYTTQANFGTGGGAGVGTGAGASGSNGGNGGANCIDCGFLCAGGSDGFFAGGGGGGGGGGGSYGGAGGAGGRGANGVSWSGGPFGGAGGNGGAAGGTYGNGTDASDVTLGSGGAGGGGGGWLNTLNQNTATAGGNGGAGGGGVNLIASNNLTFAGTISANGLTGGTGGNGGANRFSGYDCNTCSVSCCGETECRDNDQCGVCTYYTLGTEGGAGAAGGGGSGGGIKLQALGNMVVTGSLSAQGGNGGAMGGSPSTTNGLCFQNTRAGGAGGGGRIKIIVNPCATNNVSPSSVNRDAGSAGAGSNNHANGLTGNIGTYVNNIIHPSFITLTPGTISAAQTICAEYTPANITSTTAATGGIGTYTYQWYSSSLCAAATTGTGQTPIAGWSAISGATSSTLTSAQIGALTSTTCYQLRVRSGECYAWTNRIQITVNPIATANAGSAATICTGTTHILSGSSVGGSATTGAWSIVSTTGSLTTNVSQLSSTAQTATPSVVTFTPTLGTFGTATLRLTTDDPDGAGPCNPATSDVIITVDQNPTPSNAGVNFSICNSATATLAGNAPTVGIGTWSVVSGTATITSPNSPTSGLTGLVTGSPSSSVTLRWTISNGTCTPSISDVTITNFASSNGSLAVSVPSTICEGQTANIGLLTGTVGNQFQWQSSPNGSAWSNIGGATLSTYTTLPLNTTTTNNWFRASVTNGTCPAAFSLPVLVNVDPAIGNNTIASNQSVCLGSTPNTIAGALPTGGNGSYAYVWQESTTSATGPWTFISGATAQNYSPGAISQQTWFRRRVTSSLCQEFSNAVQIDILTGNSNVFLVSGDTRVAIEECIDGDWTYYATALNPDQFIFAIRKYTNNFTASVTIIDEPGITTYSSLGGVGPARGTFLAGRTYDVNITSGSITTPVDIRFFVGMNELDQALTEAQALLAITPIPGSTITPLTFFKAPTTFNPATMINSGNFTFTPSNDWTYGPANPITVAPPDGFINGVAYYELTGLTSFSGGTGGYSVNDAVPALLPVELLSFTATAKENRYIKLDWVTATEINNEGFDIERSIDGIHFEKNGWINGNGNSTVINKYSFNDNEPSVGVNYYRLKQIDFDGAFEYSNIVSARISVRDNFEVSNFIPNPAESSTSLRFSSLKKQTVEISVYNVMGQLIESKTVQLLPGSQTIDFDVQNYADGTYTAIIKANNDVHSRKLIITK